MNNVKIMIPGLGTATFAMFESDPYDGINIVINEETVGTMYVAEYEAFVAKATSDFDFMYDIKMGILGDDMTDINEKYNAYASRIAREEIENG